MATHDLLGAPFGIVEALFSLEYEPTIPGWLASVKLLIAACLIAALSLSAGTGRTQSRALLGAAIVFLAMSCDEAAAIHERLQRTVDNRILTDTTDHIYDGEVLAKVVVGLTALAVVAFTVLVVLRKLRSIGSGGTTFGAGFVLLALGAVGVDLASEFLPADSRLYAAAVFLEETLEMAGATLIVYGALQGLARAPVTLHIGPGLRCHAAGRDRPPTAEPPAAAAYRLERHRRPGGDP